MMPIVKVGKWITAFGCLAILLGAAFFIYVHSLVPDPYYKGKRLSRWLQAYFDYPSVWTPDDKIGVDEAMEAAGTNAIPLLLEMLRAKDTPLKRGLLALSQKQRFIKYQPQPTWELPLEALADFEKLGSRAKNAVPALMKIYDEDKSVRAVVLSCLAFIGPSADQAIPIVIRGTEDKDGDIRANAAFALERIHTRPDKALPALIKLLSDPEPRIRPCAASALGAYRNEAKAAIPALIKASQDGDPELNKEAIQALKKIDPEWTDSPAGQNTGAP